MDNSAESRVIDSFYEENDRIIAGEGLGTIAVSSAKKPTFEQWMEEGGMNRVPMQPGEQSWTSWKCGGGPHRDELPDL